MAFLYVKREGKIEDYSDVDPPFSPAFRLKIGTFKVVSDGFKLGERFLKIVFDNALRYEVDEIYVTGFRRTPEQDRLIRMLEDWGFLFHGTKTTQAGTEQVLVRDFRPGFRHNRPPSHIPVPIAKDPPVHCSDLSPISHGTAPRLHLEYRVPLTTSCENRPNRNAISKVYVSRSYERGLRSGDVIVFYRTGSGTAPAHYTSVATTLGVVQDVITNIPSKTAFVSACRKRSVFSDEELGKHWDFTPSNRPFVVNFLYVHSFPKRPNPDAAKGRMCYR